MAPPLRFALLLMKFELLKIKLPADELVLAMAPPSQLMFLHQLFSKWLSWIKASTVKKLMAPLRAPLLLLTKLLLDTVSATAERIAPPLPSP